jgi:hypothetical protein
MVLLRSNERTPVPTLVQSLKRSPLGVLLGTALAFSAQSPLSAEISESVSTKTSDHYSRAKAPDGTFQAEFYSFGEGGVLGGATSGEALDQMTFGEVARAAVGPLSHLNYRPAIGISPDKTKLLIMVFWGTTNAPSAASGSNAFQRLQDGQGALTPPPPPDFSYMAHCSCDPSQLTNSAPGGSGSKQSEANSAFAGVAVEERLRQQADMRIAVLLGYDSELIEANNAVQTAFRNRKQDLMSEIEGSRNFLVLVAYDFQDLWKSKRRNLMWVTRLSVPEGRVNFREAMPGMIVSASEYLGRDTHGLVHEYVREGRVDVGNPKDLGEVATK